MELLNKKKHFLEIDIQQNPIGRLIIRKILTANQLFRLNN